MMLQKVVEVGSEQNVMRVAQAVTQFRVRHMLQARREKRLADLKVQLGRTLAQAKAFRAMEFTREAVVGRRTREEDVCHEHEFCDCFGDELDSARVDAMENVIMNDWSTCFMSDGIATTTTHQGMFTQ